MDRSLRARRRCSDDGPRAERGPVVAARGAPRECARRRPRQRDAVHLAEESDRRRPPVAGPRPRRLLLLALRRGGQVLAASPPALGRGHRVARPQKDQAPRHHQVLVRGVAGPPAALLRHRRPAVPDDHVLRVLAAVAAARGAAARDELPRARAVRGAARLDGCDALDLGPPAVPVPVPAGGRVAAVGQGGRAPGLARTRRQAPGGIRPTSRRDTSGIRPTSRRGTRRNRRRARRGARPGGSISSWARATRRR
mmetsp:Transcript_4946/g.20224  ORF Transcript_4946/g.20224 Transcript_4946/m.20224 type:complete len:253 (+) Transcript_4946:2328-3086(+)